MACELLTYCQFFKDHLECFPKTADYIKQKQCLGDYSSCSRYKMYKEFGGDNIPVWLDPFDTEEVKKVVQLLRKKQEVQG